MEPSIGHNSGARRPGERMILCLSAPGLTDRESRVLAIIAYHDGPGGAWPSQKAIGERCGKSRSNVANIIKRLRVKGWLSTETKGRGVRYTVHYRQVTQCDTSPDVTRHAA